MPGFEFFGEEERKEVNDVLTTGILMRYGFDAARKDIWKSRELEQAICAKFQCGLCATDFQRNFRTDNGSGRIGHWCRR